MGGGVRSSVSGRLGRGPVMPLLATATLALSPLDPHRLPAGVEAVSASAGTDLLIGLLLPAIRCCAPRGSPRQGT